MSNPQVKFVVSTPSNTNDEASGYRLIQLKDRKLSSLPFQKDDINTDIGVTTQALCYLRPKSNNILPEVETLGMMDYSDYMIIAKSNGLIEIIRDYQYKLNHHLSLNSNFVLACIPNVFNSQNNRNDTVGLEYKDGLLYCCKSNGDIYMFILNLPTDYIQWDNFFDLNNIIYPNEPKDNDESDKLQQEKLKQEQQAYIEDSEDIQARQITDFFRETQYTGRSSLKHICYYLTPIQFDEETSSSSSSSSSTSSTSSRNSNSSSQEKSLSFYMDMYKDQYIYRPSIVINLEQGISHFHINPLDRLSFLTGSQFSPIMIRRIILPMTYLNYLITYITMKKRVQEKSPVEIIPWEQLAIKNGFPSFALWIACESVYGYETASVSQWEDIRNNNGTGYLNSAVVWKQSFNHSKDKHYERLYRNIRRLPNISNPNRDDLSINSNVNHLQNQILTHHLTNSNNSNNFIRRHNAIRRSNNNDDNRHITELPESFSWQLNAFIRNIQKNNALADFNVVNTNEFNNYSNLSSEDICCYDEDLSERQDIQPDMSNVNNTSYGGDSVDLESNSSFDHPSLSSQLNPNYGVSHTFNAITPTFLTEKYKTLDIIRIDKSLVFSVFKPKYQDEEVTKINLFCNRDRDNYNLGSMKNDSHGETNERVIFGKALPNLTSFKKIFRLTKSLCLIVDISGLLLIDLDNIEEGFHNLSNLNESNSLISTKNITNNLAIRLSIYDIGLVSDAIVIMESFDVSPNHHVMKLNIITTCLPGEIKAFEVEFDSNHIMGHTVLQDCLRLTNVDRFTDKMSLLDCDVDMPRGEKRLLPEDFPSSSSTSSNSVPTLNDIEISNNHIKRSKPS